MVLDGRGECVRPGGHAGAYSEPVELEDLAHGQVVSRGDLVGSWRHEPSIAFRERTTELSMKAPLSVSKPADHGLGVPSFVP